MEQQCNCGMGEVFHDRKKLIEIHRKTGVGKGLTKRGFMRYIESQLIKHKFRPMKCATCGKDLHLTLSKYVYNKKYYCTEHCPHHEWQSDYDWPIECKRCGIDYKKYLEWILDGRGIPYTKYEPKGLK